MVMNEWIQIAVMACSVAAFAIGGTGPKWVRRYVLPAGLGLLAGFLASWWQGLGYALTLCAVLCMGYGERTPYWGKFLVFCGYGAASLWLGWSWWTLIIPPVCLLLFFLSNFQLTAKAFSWKIVEGSWGFLLSAAYIAALLNPWR